jgi:IstB-like ATP binding protein
MASHSNHNCLGQASSSSHAGRFPLLSETVSHRRAVPLRRSAFIRRARQNDRWPGTCWCAGTAHGSAACQPTGAMIVTSNRGFAEWGAVFGDPVVATALLDRLLHHAVVIQIEGSSYRLRLPPSLRKTSAPAHSQTHRSPSAAAAHPERPTTIPTPADPRTATRRHLGSSKAHSRGKFAAR